MRESQRVPNPVPQQGLGSAELDDLRATRWRQAHEIDALNETILVYRRGAVALAGELAELRHELAAARSLRTRAYTRDTHHEVEVTVAADDDAPEVVALAVGEALADSTADSVEAWQTIASELADRAALRHGISDDVMLLLRIKRSETTVGVEIIAA
jgi:hypothetical protein